MTNYRMKRLQNISENKQRIIMSTRQKIAVPKKKTINWTYITTSMAVIVFCIFGGQLLWDSISNPTHNSLASLIEQSEVDSIVIDVVESGESVTIINKETISSIIDWLNEVSAQPHQNFDNKQSVLYLIHLQDNDLRAISITSKNLKIDDNAYAISSEQFAKFSSFLHDGTKKETDIVEYNDRSPFEVRVESNYETSPDFHTGWKKSPNGLQQATVDGKGKQAMEEGNAILVIENLETNESSIYTYKLQVDGVVQNTPKYVEWIDDNRLFVIIGFAHGTVTKGGQLYVLDMRDHTVDLVFDNLTEKEEIMTITANGDGTFTYQKHVYHDDNYSEGHIEEGTLGDSDAVPASDVSDLLIEKSEDIFNFMKSHDWASFSEYIHPEGVTFSFDAAIGFDPKNSNTLMKETIEQIGKQNSNIDWGTDNSAKRHIMSINDYVDQYLFKLYGNQTLDYQVVTFNESSVNSGGIINTIHEKFPNAKYVEYYAAPENDIDWQALRFVFEQSDNEWYLAAVVRDVWDP